MAKYWRNRRTTIGLGLLRLYPRAWRDRYQSEVAAMFAESVPTWGALANLAGHAIWERRYLAGAILRAYLVTCVAAVLVSCAFLVSTSTGPTWTPVGIGRWLVNELRFLIEWIEFTAVHTLSFTLYAVFFGYSLLYSVPIGVLLAATGIGQRFPRVSKVLWLASFLGFVLWVNFGPYQLHQTAMVYGLVAGGWVLARRLFVAPPDASSGSRPRTATFADRFWTSRDSRSVDSRLFLQAIR